MNLLLRTLRIARTERWVGEGLGLEWFLLR
jgi:hypothetical protein